MCLKACGAQGRLPSTCAMSPAVRLSAYCCAAAELSAFAHAWAGAQHECLLWIVLPWHKGPSQCSAPDSVCEFAAHSCSPKVGLPAGIADAYWELRIKPWDVAAGTLLVTEAGAPTCIRDPCSMGGEQLLQVFTSIAWQPTKGLLAKVCQQLPMLCRTATRQEPNSP